MDITTEDSKLFKLPKDIWVDEYKSSVNSYTYGNSLAADGYTTAMEHKMARMEEMEEKSRRNTPIAKQI